MIGASTILVSQHRYLKALPINALTTMAGRFTYSQRSKEAPMDFTWTDRSPVKPAWASGSQEQNTPCKRMSSFNTFTRAEVTHST